MINQARPGVQVVRCAKVTTCDIPVRVWEAIRDIQIPTGGTSKPQGGWTGSDELVAKILTG